MTIGGGLLGKNRSASDGDSAAAAVAWDHSNHEDFYKYYAAQSVSKEAFQRFLAIRDVVLRVLEQGHPAAHPLCVADIGCGAGTLSSLWAMKGHRVSGVDVSAQLVELAKERASEAGLSIDFRVGTATELPWADRSMDVCLVPELLEHIRDWERCLDECSRVLKPGGVLFVTTDNKLCPFQQEFKLPLYSWYPGFAKRYFERLATTKRPELVNYAKYPAVNWFTYYSLRAALAKRGFASMDKFDAATLEKTGLAKRLILRMITEWSGMRLLAHIATPYTLIIGTRQADAP